MSIENNWLYTQEDLDKAPSVIHPTAPITPQQEIAKRREGIRYILELGKALNLAVDPTLATASLFFHRFYMQHSFEDFQAGPTALACIFLAGKVEETPKKCKDIVAVAKEHSPSIFVSPKLVDEVIQIEKVLLQTLRFDLHQEHPYTFLVRYAKDFKIDKDKMSQVVQHAWTFINDSLYTTMCLLWEPEIIAISLLYMAFKITIPALKIDSSKLDRNENDQWWDSYVSNLTIPMMEDICHKVLDYYSSSKNTEENDSTTAAQNSAAILNGYHRNS